MPGAGKQEPRIQAQIVELLEAGFDPTTIHRRLKVGRSSIYRMKRSLQQHGTPYMPSELNKKNGRPKVLTTEQELEVRDWLRKPENRGRYLDDLVWLIHDRFQIICSTTTMSKMKRKWLRVIEYEEHGRPLDMVTWNAVQETHPDLPILQQSEARPDPEEEARPKARAKGGRNGPLQKFGRQPAPLAPGSQLQQSGSPAHDPQLQHAGPLAHDPQLQQTVPGAQAPELPQGLPYQTTQQLPVQDMMQAPQARMQVPIAPQIDSRLQQPVQTDIASSMPAGCIMRTMQQRGAA